MFSVHSLTWSKLLCLFSSLEKVFQTIYQDQQCTGSTAQHNCKYIFCKQQSKRTLIFYPVYVLYSTLSTVTDSSFYWHWNRKFPLINYPPKYIQFVQSHQANYSKAHTPWLVHVCKKIKYSDVLKS